MAEAMAGDRSPEGTAHRDSYEADADPARPGHRGRGDEAAQALRTEPWKAHGLSLQAASPGPGRDRRPGATEPTRKPQEKNKQIRGHGAGGRPPGAEEGPPPPWRSSRFSTSSGRPTSSRPPPPPRRQAEIESVRLPPPSRSPISSARSPSLGAPNLGAIDEFERVNERYAYLTGQRGRRAPRQEGSWRTSSRTITQEMTEIFRPGVRPDQSSISARPSRRCSAAARASWCWRTPPSP